jgi:MerR family redox-sensitive transcriptional activator SoxR
VTPAATLSIGELARRTGLSVSAIRFYETRGLVRASRGSGNQRRFARSDIRRLSFALIAQQLGMSLTEIETELSTLPERRTPTVADWRAIGARLRGVLAAKITMLQRTSELLDGCIGCGACRWIVARFIIPATERRVAVRGHGSCWGTRRRISMAAEPTNRPLR